MSFVLIQRTLPARSEHTTVDSGPIGSSSGLMFAFPPCASMICRIFFSALPESIISCAKAGPSFTPTISKSIPARLTAFCLKSGGPFPISVVRASFASRAGPMLNPNGCSPNVNAH